MGDFDSMSDEIKANKARMKEHSKKEKLAFFFLYYKWPFLGILFVAAVLFFLIRSCAIYQPNPYVSGIFINSEATALIEKSYETEYAQAIELADNTLDICFDFSMNYTVGGENDGDAKDTPIMMMALSEAGDTDFAIIDEETFSFFAKNGYFIDLREVLSSDFLSKAKDTDSIWYMTYENVPDEYPIGIRLTRDNAPYLWDSGIYSDKTPSVIFAIFYSAPRKARAAEYLSFLLN